MAFVVDAWRRSFEASPAVHGADREHYRAEMTRTIHAIVGARDTTTRVACDHEDDDVVLGFACFTGPALDARTSSATLHYVYVRSDFRQMGITKSLLDGVDVAHYTFRTLAGERRLHARERGWKFTPRFTL